MPRFTQQQLREVVLRDPAGEYVVFADHRADPTLVLPEVRSAPNVTVRTIPEAASKSAGHYMEWIGRQGVDLYHATTPFYLEQLILPEFDVCPMVATLYDLIPLLFPAHYIVNERLRGSYELAAEFVSGATRVLAISESARSDAHAHLGIPLDRIDVASPFAEPFFRPLSAEDIDAALVGLESRVRLPRTMILAVSHLHFTKNVEGLLRGYSLVPERVRAQIPLVVACHLDPHGEARIRELARRLRISDDLIITGLVTDVELAALYNRALLAVHPSRYEGFGLPVLEAMQCGLPVVTSTSSSLPEVAGGAAELVHPEDAPGLADAILRLFEDPGRRAELRERGLRRAAHYSPDLLANDTLRTYRKCVDDPPRTESRGMRTRVMVGGEPARNGRSDLLGPPAGREYDIDRLITDTMIRQQWIDQAAVELTATGESVDQALRVLQRREAADVAHPDPFAVSVATTRVELDADAAIGRVPTSIVALLDALALPGGTVVDLWAGDGGFSLAAAAAGHAVLALDGSSVSAARLRGAAFRRGLHRLRVVNAPPPVAVGELVMELGLWPVRVARIEFGTCGPDIIDRLAGLLMSDDGPALFLVGETGGPPSEPLEALERLGYSVYIIGDRHLVGISSATAPWDLPMSLAVKAPPALAGWEVDLAPVRSGVGRP